MKKWALILAVLLASHIFSGCAVLRWKLEKSVDKPTGVVQLKGLHDEVTISRDDLGIPYIEAKNEDDLFFATGYAMASDRLWQMVGRKMAMQGRLSEIFGEDTLDVDIFFRTFGMRKYVEDALSGIDKQSLSVLESFSRGVNAYISTHADLPFEFFLTRYKPEPWTPVDCLYAFGLVSWGLSFNLSEELDFLAFAGRLGYEKAAWLLPIYPDETLPLDEAMKLKAIPYAELIPRQAMQKGKTALNESIPKPMPASNNWALSGSRTLSGKSIVCNDTHLELTIPSAWMIMHLKCPTYEAAGVMAPGMPIVVLGYNGRIAWGVTMVMADSQDIFVEKLKEENGKTFYLSKGLWLPAMERKELFRIKGKAPVEKVIRMTGHGPLLNSALKQVPVFAETYLPDLSRFGLALSWAVEGSRDTFAGFYNLAKAQTMDDARKAISMAKAVYLNFVYGDSANIAWQISGAYPVRKKGEGFLPSPGWGGEYDWEGFVPFEQLPHAENPPQGYLATANNRTVPKDYPIHITSSWAKPERAERLDEVLGSTKDATIGDMITLQSDQYSPLARKIQALFFEGPFAQELKDAMAGLKADDKGLALEALAFLKPGAFDGVLRAEPRSVSPAVYGAFIHVMTKNTFLDELGPDESDTWKAFTDLNNYGYSAPEDHLLYRPDSPFWDDIRTAQKETRASIVAKSLADAMRYCEEKMGPERKRWQWGLLHTYHFKHDFSEAVPFFLKDDLNRGPFPAGGDCHTLNVAGFSWGKSFDVVEIPAMRMIVDFSLPDPAFLTTVPGQSGNPFSPHYDDMIKPYFLTGKNHPLPFMEENIQAQYKDQLILKP